MPVNARSDDFLGTFFPSALATKAIPNFALDMSFVDEVGCAPVSSIALNFNVDNASSP